MSARGRSRTEIEHDVLAAMCAICPFRFRALRRLTADDFTTSDHRVLYRALIAGAPEPTGIAEWVAAATGWSVVTAQTWFLHASIVTYNTDLDLLKEVP